VIHTGDCVTVMAGMEPESVDAIVTDPPYGLEFMGKEWDRFDGTQQARWQGRKAGKRYDESGLGADGLGDRLRARPSYGSDSRGVRCSACGHYKFSGTPCTCTEPVWEVRTGTPPNAAAMQEWHERWATAALRVAKPGAYLLAFGGTRTVHRLTVALEDAGWIIRDLCVWAYASGFPKSKASLKPAWEPIVMARKPGQLRELAIDTCRIGYDLDSPDPATNPKYRAENGYANSNGGRRSILGTARYRDEPRATNTVGRWPANVILTDPIFDGGWEGVVGGGWQESTSAVGAWAPRGAFPIDNPNPVVYGDSGTYSRFFLIPKASRSDREPLTPGGLELGDGNKWNAGGIGERRRQAGQSQRFNVHPTVKPVELMRHLVRLVTPQGGTVLDPFLGSGTTAIAAEQEGFDWIGIEREAEYVAIARQRLVDQQRGLGLDVPAAAPRMPKTRPDYESHIPKRRSPSENWSGAWAGQEPVDEDIA
jgi:DNA modification methylase